MVWWGLVWLGMEEGEIPLIFQSKIERRKK